MDEYQKIGEATVQQENYNFTTKIKSPFYKVLVKAPHHYANAWIQNN